jgi:hypothetical protein
VGCGRSESCADERQTELVQGLMVVLTHQVLLTHRWDWTSYVSKDNHIHDLYVVPNVVALMCEHPVLRVGLIRHYTRVRRQTIQLIM